VDKILASDVDLATTLRQVNRQAVWDDESGFWYFRCRLCQGRTSPGNLNFDRVVHSDHCILKWLDVAASLREKLAALAHEQWSGWMKHLFDQCVFRIDGTAVDLSAIIPPDLVSRWRRQMHTPYADLPEPEKESDRAEAERVLELLSGDG